MQADEDSSSITQERLDALQRRIATDLNAFAAFVLPETITKPFPDFYKQLWVFILQKITTLEYGQVFRLLIGLPRGHAKTTFFKLLTTYCILYRIWEFPLIVCATEDRAHDFLSDVDDMLSSHNVKELFGNWKASKTIDNRESKIAHFLGRDIIFKAIGAGTSIRGVATKTKRPDAILFDDAQTDKNAESPTESAALLRWLVGTAFKLRSEKHCSLLYLGNMYPENCILEMLHKNKQWYSIITGAILANGEALWEELKPKKTLIEEFVHDEALGLGHVWYAEVQNDPRASKRSLLNGQAFPLWEEDFSEPKIASFITIDPSGKKRTSDDTVLCGHIVYEEGSSHYREIPSMIVGKLSPQATIDGAIEMAMEIGATHIFIEGVAYQESLVYWTDKRLKELGLLEVYKVLPIYPGKVAKLARIRSLVENILSGRVRIRSERVRAYMLGQIATFRIERTDNKDDILDCAAYGEKAWAEYEIDLRARYTSPQIENASFIPRIKCSDPISNYRRRFI